MAVEQVEQKNRWVLPGEIKSGIIEEGNGVWLVMTQSDALKALLAWLPLVTSIGNIPADIWACGRLSDQGNRILFERRPQSSPVVVELDRQMIKRSETGEQALTLSESPEKLIRMVIETARQINGRLTSDGGILSADDILEAGELLSTASERLRASLQEQNSGKAMV